jgi:hypothetical protein
MDLNILFENIGSIATSLERIADSLEQRGSNTITVSATGDAVATDAPKRKRRTKAEIEAEEAARVAAIGTEAPAAPTFPAGVALESGELIPATSIPAPVIVPPVIVPPVVAPAAPAPAAPAPAAPAPAAPAPAAPAPAAPVTSEVCGPEYQGFAPQLQFAELTKLIGPYWGNPFVQNNFVTLIEQLKLQLPLASVADRNEPRDEYKALPAEHRYWLYTSTVALIEQLKNAGAQTASI